MTKLIHPSCQEILEKLWDASPATAPDYYSTAGQIANQLLFSQEERNPSDKDKLMFGAYVEEQLERLAEKGQIKSVWVYGRYGYRTLKDRDNRCKDAPFKEIWFGGDHVGDAYARN